MKKKYLAEATVVVDSKTTDPVSGAELQADLQPSYLATQLDVIASPALAGKVVDKLHLTSNPDLRDAWISDTDGKGSMREWEAGFLLKKFLKVNASASISNVIVIAVLTPDPDFSAALANAWAEAFVQTSLDLKTEPARRQAVWFDDQLQGFRGSLESAQKRLSDYQKENDVVGTDSHVDVENEKLQQLVSALVAAQGSMYDGQARLRQTNDAVKSGQLEQLPDILGNPMLQGMTADLAHAQANLAQVSTRFDRNHPQYTSAADQVREIKRSLQQQIDTARGAIEKNTELTERRVDELKKAIDQQRDHVLALRRQQDDINVLRSEVDSAQHAYDAALMRADTVKLEGKLDQGNVSILGTAVAPGVADRPKVLLNMAVGVVFGAMLGVALALMAEINDRRLRAATDLEAEGIVVLAVVPARPKLPRRRLFLRRGQPRPALLTNAAKAPS
jgi:chain length determinant protein EpsF